MLDVPATNCTLAFEATAHFVSRFAARLFAGSTIEGATAVSPRYIIVGAVNMTNTSVSTTENTYVHNILSVVAVDATSLTSNV